MNSLFDKPEVSEQNMSTDLEVVPMTTAVAVTPMLLIERAMQSGVDPGKLYELAQQWERDQAAERFAGALATFQARCPQIKKERLLDLGGGKGPVFASLDDIMLVIKPLLADCGLSVTFSAGITDAGHLVAKCMIHHGRHVESSEITLPVPSQMRVNDTQKMGAALSYAKRYALCAALNIVVTDEDRDGEGLIEAINEKQVATIEDLLTAIDQKPGPFLGWLGVNRVCDIPAKDYAKAVSELERKAVVKGVKLGG